MRTKKALAKKPIYLAKALFTLGIQAPAKAGGNSQLTIHNSQFTIAISNS
ncbi:hypothetical protein [Flavobacterium sp. 9]|nr:hypothetical protein [Flavobacterium sp. 9]